MLDGVKVDPSRAVPADAAAARLPALLAAAAAGRASHLVDGGEALAHLVPPDALVLTGAIEATLLGAVFDAQAARFAVEVEATGYHHVGNTVGAVLSWLWESAPAAALHWLAHYADALAAALADRAVAAPPFRALWPAVTIALDFPDHPEQAPAFEAAARRWLTELTDLFDPAELAGAERVRGADDPWPDVTAGGRRFAKKRRRDLRAGDFVPAEAGADLDFDDRWCRIVALAPAAMTLCDATGQHAAVPIGAPGDLTPVRSREPWQWGLPR